MQFLKIIDRGSSIALSQILIILIEISSLPQALLILKDLLILRISSSVKLITDTLEVKLRFKKLGNLLLFVNGEYFETKKSLKRLDFFLKSVTSLLPTFSDGIRGIFFYSEDKRKHFRARSSTIQLLS